MIVSTIHRAFYRFSGRYSPIEGPLLWRWLLPDPAVFAPAWDSLRQWFITGTLYIAIRWPFRHVFVFSELRVAGHGNFLHSGI
jgi:hypothetical protein